ncbi:MAG: hypothetical protein JXR41_15270 [Bacteroidales bacterium]|nr:hypothetical protein [Bacteroidales bacterium]MBN2764453.1 hypothetical protein [Bacteroidales bacterium]
MKRNRFFTGLLLITGIISLFAYLVYHFFLPSLYTPVFPYILGFFFLVNSIFFIVFHRIYRPDNNRFIRQFMIWFGVKFLIYLTSALVVLLLFRQEALNIAVAFMVLYLIYTGYEVLWLTSLVKRKEHK